MTAVSTAPISGTERFEKMIGSARRRTALPLVAVIVALAPFPSVRSIADHESAQLPGAAFLGEAGAIIAHAAHAASFHPGGALAGQLDLDPIAPIVERAR